MKKLQIVVALLPCFLMACATHTPQVHVQPIIEANKKTKTAIKKTQAHQKQLTESQIKVSGTLQSVMDDLNKLLGK